MRDTGPAVAVSAAREPGGVRVRFRRSRPVEPPRRARLERDGGSVDEIVHSPDHRTVSVLWREPSGELRCYFPLGGVGRFAAGGATRNETVSYVFLDEPGVRVRMDLPRACAMRPVLPLRVHVAPAGLPATLRTGSAVFRVGAAEQHVALALPRSARGVLAEGELEVELATARGRTFNFLIGVDADGTPTATTGYIETGTGG